MTLAPCLKKLLTSYTKHRSYKGLINWFTTKISVSLSRSRCFLIKQNVNKRSSLKKWFNLIFIGLFYIRLYIMFVFYKIAPLLIFLNNNPITLKFGRWLFLTCTIKIHWHIFWLKSAYFCWSQHFSVQSQQKVLIFLKLLRLHKSFQ